MVAQRFKINGKATALTTGWLDRSLHARTSRLLTMAAFRSSSKVTNGCAPALERISTFDGASDLWAAAMMADACWRCSIAAAISGA